MKILNYAPLGLIALDIKANPPWPPFAKGGDVRPPVVAMSNCTKFLFHLRV